MRVRWRNLGLWEVVVVLLLGKSLLCLRCLLRPRAVVVLDPGLLLVEVVVGVVAVVAAGEGGRRGRV